MSRTPSFTQEIEGKFHQEDTEPAPPYQESESMSTPPEKPSSRSQTLLTAQERAVELRRQMVKLLVDGHVEPLLENALLHGSNSQTIIVVPSDAIVTSTVLTTSHLVHRPKASTNIVQLQGPNSTEAFWTQPRVVEDLEKEIRSNLFGLRDSTPLVESHPPQPAHLNSAVSGQKSWLKRTFGTPGPDHDPTGSTGNWNLGWRSEQEQRRYQYGPSSTVKDVAFRMETELGLLTTMTARCIVIELEGNP